MNEDKPPLTHIQLNEHAARLRAATERGSGAASAFRILEAFTLLVADLLTALADEERERAKQELREQRK